MSEIIVIERGKMCQCSELRLSVMEVGLFVCSLYGKREWESCRHGSIVRLATTADILAGLAAEAYRRVREAEKAAKGDSREDEH